MMIGESKSTGASRRLAVSVAIVVGGAAVLLVAKIGSMLVLGGLTGAAWDRGDFAEARQLGNAQLIANFIEPHKAHFAVGTAAAAENDLPAARAALAMALELSTAADDCTVRLNLLLVWEKTGAEQREAGQMDAAEQSLESGLRIAEQAGNSCRTGQLKPVAERLNAQFGAAADEKAEQSEPEDGTAEPAPTEEPAEMQAIDELMSEGKSRQAAEEPRGAGTPNPVSRPW